MNLLPAILWMEVVIFAAVTPGWAVNESPGSEAQRLSTIERRVGGRLGVAMLNTASGRHFEYRATERFPMCSTFKFLAAAAVLDQCDQKKQQLDRRIPYGQEDLLEYAPVTKQHLAEGSMPLGELCAAAIEYSDNTAGNLLLQVIGGPAKLTKYLRSLGDEITRLDRNEPSLNTAIKGDLRDTTTPASMLYDMEKLLIRDALSTSSKQQLETWLIANTTGAKRLRAGLPTNWRIGDKTGTGENGATNDIAIVWPPDQAPILVTAYLVDSTASSADREAAIAEVGRLVAAGKDQEMLENRDGKRCVIQSPGSASFDNLAKDRR